MAQATPSPEMSKLEQSIRKNAVTVAKRQFLDDLIKARNSVEGSQWADYKATNDLTKAAETWFDALAPIIADGAVREFIASYHNLVDQFPELRQTAYEEGLQDGQQDI